MNDAEDGNIIPGRTVEDDVVPDWEASDVWPEIPVAPSTQVGMARKELEARRNGFDQSGRDFEAIAVARNVKPYFIRSSYALGATWCAIRKL